MKRRDFLGDLRSALSDERLAPYRTADGRDEGALARYLWNVELSEALGPLLGAVEVALRNRLHDALQAHTGRPDWYHAPGLLLPVDRQTVQNTEAALARSGKRSAGHIVAALTFGFWTTLLSRPYHRLWQQTIGAVVPGAPGRFRQRKRVYERLDRIRRLRNRVVHHEPIWRDPSLAQQHRDALDALKWLSASLHLLTLAGDRFPDALATGLVRSTTRVDTTLLTNCPD